MEINFEFIMQKLQGMFKLMDTNNDQFITFEEIIKSINNDTGDVSSKFEELEINNT